MREILFRGKSIVSDSPSDPGYWRYGSLINRTYCYDDYTWDTLYILKSTDSDMDETTEVWPETVGQYTGTHDKNRRNIFEGDIVKTKYGRLCKVIWFESKRESCWDLEPVDTQENIWHTQAPDVYDLWKPDNLEVVGNIHDSPELLKGVTNVPESTND